MNDRKLGDSIAAFVGTFVTVYAALKIGKLLGRREAIMAILDADIERWREDNYPTPTASEQHELDAIKRQASESTTAQEFARRRR